jgi:hypothetical protein
MALFRCKASGNTIEFTNEVDIVSMRGMSHYEEVKAVEEPKKEEQNTTLTLPKKQK